MKIVKMFDYCEIRKETGIDIFDYYDNICNDSAISWFVEEPDENEECAKINNYFLNHGANLNEEVWIEISY